MVAGPIHATGITRQYGKHHATVSRESAPDPPPPAHPGKHHYLLPSSAASLSKYQSEEPRGGTYQIADRAPTLCASVQVPGSFSSGAACRSGTYGRISTTFTVDNRLATRDSAPVG